MKGQDNPESVRLPGERGKAGSWLHPWNLVVLEREGTPHLTIMQPCCRRQPWLWVTGAGSFLYAAPRRARHADAGSALPPDDSRYLPARRTTCPRARRRPDSPRPGSRRPGAGQTGGWPWAATKHCTSFTVLQLRQLCQQPPGVIHEGPVRDRQPGLLRRSLALGRMA